MKISIITINYNDAEGLEKTIKSVIEQSYSNVEYIVIDGNSTDGSVDIIKKYADKISYWISETDKGIYNAMNKGINQAKGEYYLFLNSGDMLADSNVLHKVFDNKAYSTLLVRGNMILDKEIPEKNINKGDNVVTLKEVIDSSLCHQATFMHRSTFHKYGLYDENYKIVSDWKLFLEMIYYGEATEYVDVDIAIFDMHGISNDQNWTERQQSERMSVLNKLIPNTIQLDYEKLFDLEKKVDFSQQYYITNFVMAHRFPRLFLRVLHKIYTILKL